MVYPNCIYMCFSDLKLFNCLQRMSTSVVRILLSYLTTTYKHNKIKQLFLDRATIYRFLDIDLELIHLQKWYSNFQKMPKNDSCFPFAKTTESVRLDAETLRKRRGQIGLLVGSRRCQGRGGSFAIRRHLLLRRLRVLDLLLPFQSGKWLEGVPCLIDGALLVMGPHVAALRKAKSAVGARVRFRPAVVVEVRLEMVLFGEGLGTERALVGLQSRVQPGSLIGKSIYSGSHLI